MDNLMMDNLIVTKLAISLIGAYIGIKVSNDKLTTYMVGAITMYIICKIG